MTPVIPAKGAPAPLPSLPPASPSKPSDPAAPSVGSSSYVALNGGNGSAFKTKADLLAALSDARLFGSALKDYEAAKDGKYLRVNLALDAIRSAISGDGKSAAAVQRISMWLSDSTLLQDTAVAHVARVNLVKALKQAPKDPAIDESVKAILEALQKNYSSASAPKEAAPAEAPKSLSAQLEDANLFGEHFKAYNEKRSKEYAAVTLALNEIRGIATGKTKDTDIAKLRIEKWLGDSTLLVDKVPTQARINLIKALGAATSTPGIAAVLAALKADYSKSGSKAEAAPPPAEDKPKVEKSGSTYRTRPKAKLKDKREDTIQTFQNNMNPVIRRVFERYLKNDGGALTTEMMVTVNQATGEISAIDFSNVKTSAGEGNLQSFFGEVANALRRSFRFKESALDNAGLNFIKVPIKFVVQ
ncbi:MAG TPA: hypothetical protein VJR29_04105 [bacterium]|nr:hypothetical protein [bacterium]